MKQPMQPIVRSSNGEPRFQRNAIVHYLLEQGGIDLNHLASIPFSQADRTQFAQLLGYTLKGFHELPYVSDAAAKAATDEAKSQGFDTCGCREFGCTIHGGVEEEADQT